MPDSPSSSPPARRLSCSKPSPAAAATSPTRWRRSGSATGPSCCTSSCRTSPGRRCISDHAAPGARTSEVVKGVVDDRAHGVFQGKIRVRPDAQKTDAHQLNRNLILSSRAAVDTKPELEIYADDVKCSHGATVGDLDEAHLFYLRARGIPEPEARRMLVEAFAQDVVDLVPDDAARDHLKRHLERWLEGGR
jgi:Fe-S cluster assembly protein SufD